MLERRDHRKAQIIISLSGSQAVAISELEALMTQAGSTYYNTGKFAKIRIRKEFPAAWALLDNEFHMPKGLVTIDDDTYDALTDELKKLKPKSKVLKKIGAKVSTGKGKPPKVKLKHFMGSLDKIKPDDADEWLKKRKGPYVVSNKEDGVSIQINYRPGQPTEAATRGDGEIGQDISHLLPHMDVPKTLKEPMDVRGEIIMPEAVFNKKWSKAKVGKDGFENARNMVSGMVNRKDVHAGIKDVHVVIYSVLSPRGTPSAQLKKLEKLGFNVVPHKLYKSLTAKKLAEILTLRKKKTKRAIDGLVVEQDKAVSIRAGVNPEHAVAFKMANADDIVTVPVKAVVWEESRHKNLIPRIEIDPIRLSGVTVTYATGHNAFFIENGFRYKDRKKGLPVRPIGPGAMIRITRSGDVIPHVISVEKAAKKASLPDDQYDYSYGPNKVNIKINKKSELSKVKHITYFFTKLKVEGVQQGVIQKLYDSGLNTILKIVRAKKERFLEIEGIKEKSAAKFRNNIDKMLKTVTLPALMAASGKFGAGLGEKRFVPMIKANPKLMEKKLGPKALRKIAMETEGFSDVLSDQFVEAFPDFAKFYRMLGVKAAAPAVTKVVGKAFKDQAVAFTGVRDAEATKAIEAQGGKVVSGVSSKTTMLITKEMNSTSDKAKKARAMGITVMSHSELRKKLKL